MKKRIPCRDRFIRLYDDSPRHAAGRGFTLIELLVVVLIMGVILGVIGACLAAGIRAWDEAAKFGNAESDAMVGLRIMEKDMMNSFPYSAIAFCGRRNDVSFASLVVPNGPLSRREGGDAQVRIGTVSYVFDAGSMTMLRSQQTHFLDSDEVKMPERIMSDLRDMSFEYYSLDVGKGAGSWRDQWTDPTNRPVAVRINLSFQGRDNLLTRTVVLPVVNGSVP